MLLRVSLRFGSDRRIARFSLYPVVSEAFIVDRCRLIGRKMVKLSLHGSAAIRSFTGPER
jgi:hypothetical protein